MIKRTIEISREPAHVTVQHAQLVLKRDGQVVGQAPCEDVGVILVDQPQVTYSHAALTALAESDAVLVVCGRDHLPAAILLPLADHSQVVWRISDQLAVSRPLRKQLWKQLIQAKIRAQAGNLAVGTPARSKLLDLARQVRSGDPSNLEAQAARVYWQNYLPEAVFRRDVDANGLNSLLNYGYAVIRAALARAIVAAGMLPSLGLHHCNRSNPFCLADDLIEPLRPLVDDQARELFRQGYDTLTAECKAGLLTLLACDVRLGGETGPLMVSLHRFIASLAKCYRGEAKRLEIPAMLADEPVLASDSPGA
ncbi:MAG: type II CRISPR-associated endonuclease Cas1 [Pirellulaceae bacterium]|nr:type II CRISPR-associated endonuclease Cas1 [Pirellulaceae bacterium]